MSRRVKKEKIDLLTTDLNYKVLVGESVLRFSFTKELLVEEEPARDRGKPFPLNNIVAGVDLTTVDIIGKDRVSLQGNLRGKALFYGQGGTREVTWSDEEFYREAGLRGAQAGMEVSAHGRIVFIGEEDPPLEAEGRLLYQLNIEIEVLLALVDPQQLTVAVGVKDIAPEKVSRKVLAVEELLAEHIFHLEVTKETGFSEELSYAKIIDCFLPDFSYEWGQGTIDFKGEVVVASFVLAGGKGNLQETRQKFGQQLPFPGQKKEGVQVRLFPSIGEATCITSGQDAHYHITVDVFARVTRVIRQEVIDALEGAAVKKEYLLLPKVWGVVEEPLELVQKLAFNYPREITAGFCRFRNLDCSPQEDRLSVNGSLGKNVYYFPVSEHTSRFRKEGADEAGEADEAGIAEMEEMAGAAGMPEAASLPDAPAQVLPHVLKVEDTFFSDLYLPGVNPHAETTIYFQPRGTEYVPADNDTLQISHLLMEIKAWEIQEVAIVVPSRVPPGTSMVIYAVRPGDTLLKISRAYGLKTGVIAAANELEEDAGLQAGQKLLVPLMHGEGTPG